MRNRYNDIIRSLGQRIGAELMREAIIRVQGRLNEELDSVLDQCDRETGRCGTATTGTTRERVHVEVLDAEFEEV